MWSSQWEHNHYIQFLFANRALGPHPGHTRSFKERGHSEIVLRDCWTNELTMIRVITQWFKIWTHPELQSLTKWWLIRVLLVPPQKILHPTEVRAINKWSIVAIQSFLLICLKSFVFFFYTRTFRTKVIFHVWTDNLALTKAIAT